MVKPKTLTIQELLLVRENKSWDEEPFWDGSLRFHLSRLEKSKKIKFIGLFGGATLIAMILLGLIATIANWQSGRTNFSLAISLVLLLIFFARQTREILVAISRTYELRDQLMRVGIDHDVWVYERGGSKS